ncbi:MAG TPA: hypothetical protein VNH11_30275 [Pirellulales bacterium]|nr:hypothetical protein [Pirellulales bacterium]
MPFIFPREAALLGCALQEYLDSDDERACFFDFLDKRLSPFYPPIARVSTVLMNVDDVPPDITWVEREPGIFRAGFARSLPESYFLAASESLREDVESSEEGPGRSALVAWASRQAIQSTRIDPSARNLLDIIAELVAPHAERSPADDARFNLATSETPWGLVQQRGFNHPNTKRGGIDDRNKIDAVISGLASGDDAAAFDAGRAIGSILAACEDWQQELFYLLYISGNKDIERFEKARAGWRATIRKRLPILAESALLAPDGNAATCLRHLAETCLPYQIQALAPDKWGGFRDDLYGEWQDDVADEIRNVSVIRDAVWLAFGEILHSAQGDPDARGAAAPRLAAQQMLRLVRLTEESSPDKIRGTLLQVQTMLEKGDASAFPEQVVLCLGPAIKGLARRVWNEKFTNTQPEPKVSTVLQERVMHGDELERRFASIAMNLYKSYRIPSQHDVERFKCSLAEALYFFLGVRLLLELSDAIGRRR